MHIYDLTADELRTLLRVSQTIGIHNERDLLELACKHNIRSGGQLINFIYAATVMPWLLDYAA